jgi:hypothetical protein
MSCSGSEISVCRWLLDLRCIVYHLANGFRATQQQGLTCGPRKQGDVGEENLSKGGLPVNMQFARWRLSGNALKHWRYATGRVMQHALALRSVVRLQATSAGRHQLSEELQCIRKMQLTESRRHASSFVWRGRRT